MMDNYFEDGFFAFPHVPENASGEVILGSLYRALGLASVKESGVGTEAKNFRKNVLKGFKRNNIISPSGLHDEHFLYIIENLIESPKLGSQDKKDVFYLTPLIPELANYGSVARYTGNPWNPGDYLLNMIYRGTADQNEAERIIHTFQKALKVNKAKESEEYADDIWSNFLQKEIEAWRPSNLEDPSCIITTRNKQNIKFDKGYDYPARLFTRDIQVLLYLKQKLTRKRWIGILESYLRLIITIDVLWICHLSTELLNILKMQYTENNEFVNRNKIHAIFTNYEFFTITSKTTPAIVDMVSNYVKSSLILNRLKEGLDLNKSQEIIDYSIDSVISFIELIKNRNDKKRFEEEVRSVNEYLDQNIGILFGAKGTRSNNLSEFLKYVPSRRSTAIAVKSSYDQGYWYNKSGSARSSPWIFEPGPSALTSLLQCCCVTFKMDFVSIGDFVQFLSSYGIKTDENELSQGRSGQILRGLGFILDSPDAEGGIMIRKPY